MSTSKGSAPGAPAECDSAGFLSSLKNLGSYIPFWGNTGSPSHKGASDEPQDTEGKARSGTESGRDVQENKTTETQPKKQKRSRRSPKDSDLRSGWSLVKKCSRGTIPKSTENST